MTTVQTVCDAMNTDKSFKSQASKASKIIPQGMNDSRESLQPGGSQCMNNWGGGGGGASLIPT